MASAETAQVAADLTASMLGEAARNLAGEAGGENAVRMLNEMRPDQVAEAPQARPVVSNVSPAAEAAPLNEPAVEEPEDEEPVVSFEPQLSDELQALLDEPDFDEEAALEVAAEAPDTYDENYDADTAAKLRAADKKIKWLEEQNASKSRKGWFEEQARAYPLLQTYAAAELKEALAGTTSRRAAARAAALLNERYSKVLAPAIADLTAAKAAAKQEAEAAARTKAADQWGLPAVEPAGAAGVSEQDRKLQESRAAGKPLVDRIKILMGG